MTEAPQDSPTGQLICTSIEQAKLELGLEGRLFDHNFKMARHLLTECWIKKIWKETSDYGIRIVERTMSLQTECEGNRMLMEAFMQNGYKGRELHTRGRNSVNSTNVHFIFDVRLLRILQMARVTNVWWQPYIATDCH
jgi:hypothetical protein